MFRPEIATGPQSITSEVIYRSIGGQIVPKECINTLSQPQESRGTGESFKLDNDSLRELSRPDEMPEINKILQPEDTLRPNHGHSY